MSFLRGDRVFSPIFRDPFTPLFSRSSFHSPLSVSRAFDTPYYSPFSPFITAVYEEPRSRHEDHSPQASSQPSSTNKAVEASPSHSAESISKSNAPQSQQDVSCTDRSEEGGRHTGGRRHHRQNRPSHQQQMQLWSPFTGSLFPSSFMNSAFAPLTPLTNAVRAMPEITLDMFSTPQLYNIHASVPGMEKKDIKVTVEEGVLTIQAERKESNSRGPSRKAASTSSASPSPSAQSSTHQGSPSTTTTDAASSSQQPFTAEMKYPTEEKEEKTASSTTDSSSTSSAAPTTAGTKDATASSSSTVSTNEASDAMVEDEGDVDFHHVESFYGRVERSVQLPEDAKVDELTARYENGVLKIDIPRIQEQKTKGRRIEIQ